METSMKTRSRAAKLGRVAAFSVAAPGIGAAFLAPNASAATVDNPMVDQFNDLTAAVDSAADSVGIQVPELPTLPAPVVPDMTTLPVNLLRRDDNAAEGATPVEVTPVAAAGPGPDTFTQQDVVDAANATRQVKVDTVNRVAQDMLSGDMSTIGELTGVLNIPSAQDVSDIGSSVGDIVNDLAGGQALADAQATFDEFMNSDSYTAWRDNTDNPFAQREGSGVARAADGIQAYIDAVSARPFETITQTIAEAGGPIRLLTDPVGAITQVITRVAGPDFVADLFSWVNNDVIPDLRDTFREALPFLAIPLATGALGALLGAPLGALPGSGIGAVLGALNPLNLLGAIPGAILGGLATGIPGALAGLIGSTLAFLPLMAALPLMGAAGGSALALAIAATITYGTWLLSFIPVALLSGLAGVGAALLVGIGLLALSGLNPIMIPAAIGGGILAGLLVFTLGIGGYALLTFLIPTIAFALIAPLLTLGLGGLGALLGLGAGTLAAAIGIPLITALMAAVSALPGAILGGLLGIGLSSLISALIGSVIGGLIGAGIGSLIGGTLGFLAGVIPGIAAFLFVWLTKFSDLASDWVNGPLGRVLDALRQGWETSALRHIFDDATDFWNGTDTGSDLASLLGQLAALGSVAGFLDGRRLRDLLLDGAVRGAIPGGILGALIGGPLGFLAGLFNPLNLLGGLLGGITGALVGAPLGAALGKGLSLLLGIGTTLVATPLLFLPILAALTGLWAAVAIPATLAALASTLIGPLALAVGSTIIGGLLLSSPLWVPLILGATVLTLVAFALANPAILVITGGAAAALLPFAFAIGAVGAVLAIGAVIVILGSLALAAVFIGLPVFLLTIPLFIFPALAVPLLSLLALPLLIPVAAGLSLLTGMSLGALVDNLSSLLTVPLGALLGALTGATVGAVTGTLVNALVRALVYGTAGAGLGALAGASVGAVVGAILALLSSLRGSVRMEGNSIIADGQIYNTGYQREPVAPTVAPQGRVAVPKFADARYGTGVSTGVDRSLVDVKELVLA